MRIVDLHCDWLWQYAAETTLFPPSDYGEVPDRLAALDGYLLGATAAILFCSRKASDWGSRADRWAALDELLTRYEAEHAGRLLFGPEDLARIAVEPADGLCWGILGIAGLDHLVRERNDLDGLVRAFERGVRVFQIVEGVESRIGDSAIQNEEGRLTELGFAALTRLFEIAPPAGQSGPRPVLDVAGMIAPMLSDVFEWFEGDAERSSRLLLLSSCGPSGGLAPNRRDEQDSTATTSEKLRRFRALGGVIGVTPGPPAVISGQALQEMIDAIASIPFMGRPGYEGIGIGTDFLRLPEVLPEFPDIERLTRWLVSTFGPETADGLGDQTARRLLFAAAGGVS
jgi:membrane dipeptidase